MTSHQNKMDPFLLRGFLTEKVYDWRQQSDRSSILGKQVESLIISSCTM